MRGLECLLMLLTPQKKVASNLTIHSFLRRILGFLFVKNATNFKRTRTGKSGASFRAKTVKFKIASKYDFEISSM
jgi:hypothetical protein